MIKHFGKPVKLSLTMSIKNVHIGRDRKENIYAYNDKPRGYSQQKKAISRRNENQTDLDERFTFAA